MSALNAVMVGRGHRASWLPADRRRLESCSPVIGRIPAPSLAEHANISVRSMMGFAALRAAHSAFAMATQKHLGWARDRAPVAATPP